MTANATAERRTPAPGSPAPGPRGLAPVGPLSGGARLGHGARGLQRGRQRLGVFRPRPGALARLPLERGRHGRHLRRAAAPVLRAGAVERPRPDPQGARLRPHRQPGQPRRGRQGVLLLSRRHAQPQLAALSLQVSAGRLSLRAGWCEENARRSRHDPPFSLLDTGVFDENRYWDVEVRYAKASPDEIHIRIIATNRGPETATLHLLPTLWFRNTWSWGDAADEAAHLRDDRAAPADATWAVRAEHPTLGDLSPLRPRTRRRRCSPRTRATPQRLWGAPNASPYVKDAFHRCVIEGETRRRQPGAHRHQVRRLAMSSRSSPGRRATIGLTLSRQPLARALRQREVIFAQRESEADGLLRRAAARRRRRGPPHPAPGAGRHDLEQAVLPLRRGALARRRPAAAAGRIAAAGATAHWRHLKAARRHLHAGHLGVPLVRRLGPGLPLRRAGAGRRGLRQGPDRAAAQGALPASQRPDPGLRVGLRRRQSAGAGDGGAQGVPRRARAARRAATSASCSACSTSCCSTTPGGSTARTPTATTCSRAASSASTTSRSTTARSRCRPASR